MGMSRANQIATLKEAFPFIEDRSPSEYYAVFDLGIKIKDGKILTLRTELPEAFPQVPPILRIVDVGVQHSWLDESGRVIGLNELYNWNPRTSNLGHVVSLATKEFCLNAPIVNPAVTAAARTREAWKNTLPRQPSLRSSPPASQNGVPRAAPLEHIPELDNLSAEELQKLLDDETKLTEFYRSLNAVTNGLQLVESLKTSNVEKAKENLAVGSEIAITESRIKQVHREVEEAQNKLQVLLSQQRALESPIDPRKLAERFESLARQTDIESEDLAPSIFNGNGIDEEALARFRSLRVLYHHRKGMADRCKAMFGS